MKQFSFFLRSSLTVALLLAGFKGFGIQGISSANLYYTYVSGNTYKISLELEFQCMIGFLSIPQRDLILGIPKICIFDGVSAIDTISLALQPPDSGLDVTLLCIGDTSSCTSLTSTIPGIKRFVYSGNYTLPYTSSVWRFLFTGNMSSELLERTSAITNVQYPDSTIIQLVDTLNNTSYHNSNAVFPYNLPFNYCGFVPQLYVPSAIDPDGDSLRFSLGMPMNGTGYCTEGTPVNYEPGTFAWTTPTSHLLTAATPIQCTSGTTYSFNSTNGSLYFTPIEPQRSDILFNIDEYRDGSFVGSSQRELNLLIFACTYSTPCYGVPDAGNAICSTGCFGAPDTLSLSGGSVGCGFLYQWQYSTDSTTWTNITGANSDIYVYHPTVSRYYRCEVSCPYGGGTPAYSGVVLAGLSSHILHCVINSPNDSFCNGPIFYVTSCGSTAYNVTTSYGDGTWDNHALTTIPVCYAEFSHTYTMPGTYYIDQYLYEGTTPVDTLRFTYGYSYCRTLQVKFYFDANSDCIFDGGDSYLYLPVSTEVDSNGYPVDTLSATSGFYYNALGGPGTVYTFKVLSVPGGLIVTCPTSGIVYDTIQSYITNYPARFIGLNCTTSSSFDLGEHASFCAGSTTAHALIVDYNAYCTPENALMTLNFSPQYSLYSAYPTPSAVAGNVVTWNFSSLSYSNPAPVINATFVNAGAPLFIGDTVHSAYRITPVTGDADTTNNSSSSIDTVFSAFDPNSMSVIPSGYLYADTGTLLQYTINFENTGNDTAHEVYILDTLLNLNLKTIQVVAASAAMQVAYFNNVVKFDFPNIDLLDSSHHNQCDGMVIFNIKTGNGLPDYTTIFNHAGIFFDGNPPVTTNTVEDIICAECGPDMVKTVNTNAFSVYPNPAGNQLSVKADPTVCNSYLVTNAIGQILLQGKISTVITQFDISTLPQGLYYITVKSDYGVKVQKFIKM